MAQPNLGEEWDRRTEALQDRVTKALPPESPLMYSVYECDADGLPVDNLDKIPVEGPCRFVQKHESFWGKGEDYESAEIESPTWLEVCILAHRMILVTGDLHHVFLEGVSVLREEDGVKIVEFEMGS